MPNDQSPPKPVQARRLNCLLTVRQAVRLTPNMIRVTFTSPELAELSPDCAGGHCKIMLPDPGQSAEEFSNGYGDGKKPVTRTYTIRHARPEACELDIDFVAHGDEGPASAWAEYAKPGDVLGFAGPGSPKLTAQDADFYLIAADMSALPVAAASLEALPKEARGVAIFEITTEADRQIIDAPEGIDQHWLIHRNPHQSSNAQVARIEGLDFPKGRICTMIAGETGVVRSLRVFLRGEKALSRRDVYASGYWRIGLAEDAHQKVKREETEADEAAIARTSGER
ncbi:MAG: siderophore-interacting protein [Paracoccaceae bacterium]